MFLNCYVFFLNLCLDTMCIWYPQRQKKMSDPLGLELQRVARK